MPQDSSGPRKRKFRGNQFSQLKEKSPQCELKEDDEQINRALSASSKKLQPKKPKAKNKEAKSEVTNEKPDISGYRLVDMEELASVFELICCRDCGKLSIILSEVSFKRKGCSSCLRLFCTSCGWNHSFYTSKKVKKHFEVNRRLVYGMRSIGQGASSAKRFCGVMNMPPPPKPNAYQGHNKALMKAAKTVAEETMNSAASEIHNLSCEENEITKCGVSCDGTWQRRGHSSMNGCVTVISMETGKCLDVEVLSKVCQGCQRHETKEDSQEKRLWQADHQGKCKANYKGSAPAMEVKGVKRIFERSEEKHKLFYTEYFGDGDSKGFNKVENTYRDQRVTITKKECAGHVQKCVGTALHKLKKEKKGLVGRVS